MQLRKIALVNYKNIASQTYDFDAKINCFVGENGIGKTNVLDAIYYLSFAKSYFNPVATQCIRHGEDFFMIEGEYTMNERTEIIACSLKKGSKKIIKRNGKAYERFSEHIGFLPLVIISPADRDLILEGSDVRRKFMDAVISQSDKSYLKNLIDYNKVLSQRNALLKYFALNRTFDAVNLSVYNEQMVALGTQIHAKRAEFLSEFIPIFIERYKTISNGKEAVNLSYKSQLNDSDFSTLFETHLERDRMLQYTSVGVHKDDLLFELNEHSVKKFSSQGQQKSYLIALKLAQFDFIKKQSNVPPILLLDDVFDKLDEHRVEHIIKLVNQDDFGQLFISDTHKDRTEAVVKKTEQSYKIFEL